MNVETVEFNGGPAGAAHLAYLAENRGRHAPAAPRVIASGRGNIGKGFDHVIGPRGQHYDLSSNRKESIHHPIHRAPDHRELYEGSNPASYDHMRDIRVHSRVDQRPVARAGRDTVTTYPHADNTMPVYSEF